MLTNKRFIVTGGSTGIGLEIARGLVEQGNRVVITARNAERLATAAQEIGASAVVSDVGNEQEACSSVRQAVEILGGLDGLVNNAGFGVFSPLEDMKTEDFRRVLDVNVIGAAVMARECIPHLRAAGGGDIVNISSTSGLKGGKWSTIYSASKFALRSMSQSWQAELRPENIRVMLINPSEVQTEFGGRQPSPVNPHKLVAVDIAQAVVGALNLAPRGFIPELTVFATNPWAGE